MRAVLQRVSKASVDVAGVCVGRIERGWLVLLGVARGDTDADAAWMADKVINLRAFERSEEHTSELQSRRDLVCRLLLELRPPPRPPLFPYTTLFRSPAGSP